VPSVFGDRRLHIRKLNIADRSWLTDADWAAVTRINRACELGGAAAFWDELETFDDASLQLRVLGAFFPDVVRQMIEEEIGEYSLTAEDLRAILGKAGQAVH